MTAEIPRRRESDPRIDAFGLMLEQVHKGVEATKVELKEMNGHLRDHATRITIIETERSDAAKHRKEVRALRRQLITWVLGSSGVAGAIMTYRRFFQ